MINIKELSEVEKANLFDYIWPYLEPMIEARKAATEGNFNLDCRTDTGSGYSIIATDVHYCRAGIAHYGSETDMDLFVTSANNLSEIIKLMGEKLWRCQH